jgi:hypothetical protein
MIQGSNKLLKQNKKCMFDNKRKDDESPPPFEETLGGGTKRIVECGSDGKHTSTIILKDIYN